MHLHDRSSLNTSSRAAEIPFFPISLRPCHPAYPSTAENIKSFGCPVRPKNTVGDLVVNRRSLYDLHLSVRYSEATADEIYSTACGELEADALPAVTGAADVSLRALLRAREVHGAHHTAAHTFTDDRTSALQHHQQPDLVFS